MTVRPPQVLTSRMGCVVIKVACKRPTCTYVVSDHTQTHTHPSCTLGCGQRLQEALDVLPQEQQTLYRYIMTSPGDIRTQQKLACSMYRYLCAYKVLRCSPLPARRPEDHRVLTDAHTPTHTLKFAPIPIMSNNQPLSSLYPSPIPSPPSTPLPS